MDRPVNSWHATARRPWFIAAVLCLSLPAWAGCSQVSGADVPEASGGAATGTVALAPEHGAVQGGNKVFVDTGRAPGEAADLPVTAAFGDSPAVECEFDDEVNQHACTAPAREVPETVEVSVTAGGDALETASYTYTTPGVQDTPVLTVNSPALQANAAAIQDEYPSEVLLGAVLKNGEPVGQFGKAIGEAADVDYFFVPKLDDAIALREAGVTTKIVVMYMSQIEDIPLLLHYDVEVSATDQAWVQEAEEVLARTDGELNVHLWVDTGLGREGVMPDEALPLAEAIEGAEHLKLSGIATHFCCIAEEDGAAIEANDQTNKTVLQKNRFDTAIAEIRGAGLGQDAIVHAGASDVLANDLEPLYYDMLRVGGAFFASSAPDDFIYSWTTSLQQVKTLPEGWCIDYSCENETEAPTKVGLISHLPSRDDPITFTVRGEEVESLLYHGTVVTLDLSDVPDAAVGDEVTINFDPSKDYLLDATPPLPVTMGEG